jgi:hypothetical protein
VELVLTKIVKKKRKKQRKDKKIERNKERRMGHFVTKIGAFSLMVFFSSPFLHITNSKVYVYLVQLPKDFFLPKSNQKCPTIAIATHHNQEQTKKIKPKSWDVEKTCYKIFART